jgi:Uma2 family endonuclease
VTVDEYLKLEESATVSHEYVGGEIFAMFGATKRHNGIVGNISSRLWGTARSGDLRTVASTPRASSCAYRTMSSTTRT